MASGAGGVADNVDAWWTCFNMCQLGMKSMQCSKTGWTKNNMLFKWVKVTHRNVTDLPERWARVIGSFQPGITQFNAEQYWMAKCMSEWLVLKEWSFVFFPLLFLYISVFFADSLSTERIFDERSIFIHNRNETLWQNRVNINKGRRINLKRYIYFFACSRNSSANRMAETITALRRHSAVPTGWCWSRGGLATTDRPTGWRAEEKER